MAKQATSFRLSAEAERKLAATATALGVTKAAVVEMGIRLIASREGIANAGDTADTRTGRPSR
jgi:predicted DNA-binding protein